MKKLLYTLLLFLTAVCTNAQITIGGGTTVNLMPVSTGYVYNYTQQILPKAGINASGPGTISGITFYVPTTANIATAQDWTVYLGHTTKASFDNTSDWIPVSGLTQVFSGTVTAVNGQVTVTFTTPFPYDNVSNLVLAVDENTPGDQAASLFYGYSGGTNTGLYYRSDTVNPDPAAPPVGTRTSTKSVATIHGLTPAAVSACPTVSAPAAAATNVAVMPTITWGLTQNAAGYRVSMGSTPGGTDIANNVDVGNVTSFSPSAPLNYNTQYYYTVTSYNVVGTSTGCVERSFTTAALPPANDECTTAVVLAPQSGVTCVSPTAGTTLSGTASAATLTPCTGTADDDVWYSFTATSTSHQIALTNITSVGTSTSTTLYTQVFTGSCAALVNYVCDTTDASPTAIATVPGQTYYVRVYTSASGGQYAASFDICILTPPVVSNDNCVNATALTVNGGTCTVSTAGSTLYATDSMIAETPCTGVADDDVWYSFVATNSTHWVALSNIVSVGTTSSTTLYTQVFSGSCGTLVSIQCDTTDASPTVLTGLVPGQTYYIRIYNSGTGSNYANTFNICVITPVIPSNDNCGTATPLSVTPGLTCVAPTSGTTLYATDSGVASTCSGTEDDDVWYSFVATGTLHYVTLSNIVSVGATATTTLYSQIFSGTCGTLTSIVCDTTDASPTALTTVPGETYYVRVYTSSDGPQYAVTFDICITTPPTAPANDECSTAIPLTVNATLTCTSVTSGYTYAATDSGLAATCGGTADDDVWYSFTATGPVHVISLSNIVSLGTTSSTTLYLEVFSGNCSALTSMACDITDASPLLIGGLTAGQTFYVRVFSSGAGNTVNANSFDICITTPNAASPANDNCGSAVSLAVNPDMNCATVTAGTTLFASPSSVPATSCAGFEDDDVWFTFIATSGNHTVQLNNVVSVGTTTTTSLNMEMLTGTCAGLTNVACSTNKFMNIGGLVPGQTYYVRVYTASEGPNYANTFEVCVGTPPLNIPVNDECATATAIGSLPYTFTQHDGINATNNAGNIATCSTSNDGLWYTFTGDGSTVNITSTTTTPWSQQLNVYTGSCGTFTCVDYSDGTGTTTGNVETVTVPTVAGTQYYINIAYNTSTDNPEGNFTLSISTALGTGEVTSPKEVSVYPNPFNDFINISDTRDLKSVSVVDMSGRLVKTIANPARQINLSELEAGLYILKLDYKDGTAKTVKVIRK